MLLFPSDWIQHFGGDVASAVPPELGARFRYHERLRPQPSFSMIVDRMLASDPDFRVRDTGPMARVVTGEGEYGAWVAIRGERDGAQARRYIGAVFMAEFATALDVIATRPQHFKSVERLAFDLVRSQRFEMTHRPRLFFYVPPAGWQVLPAGLIANWYPLTFPNNLTNIVVPPANVFAGDELAIAELGAGLEIIETVRDEITSSSGVAGTYVRASGRRAGRPEPIHRDLAIFVVGTYAYRFRLETANTPQLAAMREVFRAVAESFRPLPTADESRTGHAFSEPLNVFDHWAG